MLDAGINLALSSDAPVVKDFNTISGIQSALSRKDFDGNILGPGEKISLEEALYAYTMGGAMANGCSSDTGSITVQKKADFVILNNRLTKDNLHTCHVLDTFIHGIQMYSAH